jgi:chitinase
LTFASSLLSLIKNLSLDRVDIDWEYPNDALQGADMVLLVKEVSETLLPSNYTVSVACPRLFSYTYLLLAEMDQYVDFWNVMAYDYARAWSNITRD